MNQSACSEADVLLDPCGQGAAEIGRLSASAGTFSLRRAHYLTKTYLAESYLSETHLTESGKPLLSEEQQRALIELIREDDPGIQQQMIVNNLRMVVDIAKRYTDCGLGLSDLVREGNHGLIHALEKFEPEGGLSFLTFANWCICLNIERALINLNNSRHPVRPAPASGAASDNTLPKNAGEHDGLSS